MGGGAAVGPSVLAMSGLRHKLVQAVEQRHWLLVLNAHVAPNLVRALVCGCMGVETGEGWEGKGHQGGGVSEERGIAWLRGRTWETAAA